MFAICFLCFQLQADTTMMVDMSGALALEAMQTYEKMFFETTKYRVVLHQNTNKAQQKYVVRACPKRKNQGSLFSQESCPEPSSPDHANLIGLEVGTFEKNVGLPQAFLAGST